MDNLNEQQRYAATYSGRHLLVLAGAGTGKTRTIIARAKHLIENGTSPQNILILSFTRRSANEIVNRIGAELRGSKSEGLLGSTFHSWCMSIIKSHPNIFPQASYTMLDEDDQISCFKLLCGQNWDYKGNNKKSINSDHIYKVYSFMVNARCTLSDAIRMIIYDNADSSLDVAKDVEVIRQIIRKYLEYKTTRKYIDYDDILLIVSKYLKSDEIVRKSIASMYEHILIDEMQDTNPLQYELLSSFYDYCNLFCVGDDAQSIYGFRGADFKTIHNFTQIVPNSEVCKLQINYRSTQQILDLSNWLIEQSPLNYNKKLIADRGNGTLPKIKHWCSEWEEADDITDSILQEVHTQGKKWKENLVLSRSAWALRKVEARCLSKDIPYLLYSGSGLMQSRHIRDVVSALRVVSNHFDELAWTRYLHLWKNIGDVTCVQIINEILTANSLGECINLLSAIVLNRRLQKELVDTLVAIKDLQTDPSQAIERAEEYMSEQLGCRYRDEWEWRKGDFPILQEVAKHTGSISEFVTEYVLDPKLEITNKRSGTNNEDGVILSTIHSAKGLEASSVYLINASARAYPTSKAILNGDDSVEEERRCLYVALTRAKDILHIYRDVQSIHTRASREVEEEKYFLNNLPLELYEPIVIARNYVDKRADIGESIKPVDLYSDIDLI